ncbi:kinesin motor domain protein [Ichthyophthirius multifiliis]|uniref:Kinesin-like protein n=1 Tax=Ichthyophthirius multifiliis TaxID=5932 RepID=G0QXK5_ICHMU|nr:kinesin motor domain protein [Ichthyophthirius multifiliis]EGR30035.1 kinesin motor domain protein [Ichthyophthirius multifiliis]|eukprot:XP_004031271.1 kinesin motor domain protein [Ichthyophthirius multifiliis]
MENQNQDDKNVQVAIRIRNLNAREKQDFAQVCVYKQDDKKVIIQNKEFIFDQIIGPQDNQKTVFELIGKKIANACLNGYNACLFAYGQTGSGKTYTMLGTEEEKGLIQRIINYIFAKLNIKGEPYIVHSQYFEIYMEEIIDLNIQQQQQQQNQKNQKNNNSIRVIEDINGVRVENLSSIQIDNHIQATEIIKKGQKNRHVSPTLMNAESSRSHSIFSMSICYKEKDAESGIVKEKLSKLNFVDLAGSERQKSTGATGQRLKEASQINQSLSCLGLVISSLVEGQKIISYRSSKLTHILKDCLGGNSRTLMVAAVSPASDSFAETLNTLKFAERVKKQDKNNNIIYEIQENGIWIKQFLQTSGFIDLISELRQKLGFDVQEISCVESAKDEEQRFS